MSVNVCERNLLAGMNIDPAQNEETDDFQTPKKAVITVQHKEKKIVTKDATKAKKIVKKVTRVVKKQKPNRIRARSPPKTFFRVVHLLNPAQKKVVEEMGFAALLKFDISELPTQLGYWLVENFDPETCMLKAGNRSIQITKEKVHEVFGIPMGKIPIEAVKAAMKDDVITQYWRSQFENLGERIAVKVVVNKIIQQKDCGRMFKLNFLVLFVTFMIEAIKCGTVNQKFLPSVTKEEEIKDLDWCGYMIECLISTRKTWNRGSHYNGPLALLVVSNTFLD